MFNLIDISLLFEKNIFMNLFVQIRMDKINNNLLLSYLNFKIYVIEH